MKSISTINQPGGISRSDGETRIVGFRVEVSEIEKCKPNYMVTNPCIIMDLAIQYLTDNGYEVTKK